MIDWESYKARLLTNGRTECDRIIDRAKRNIASQVNRNVACREVLVDQVPQTLFINRSEVPKKKYFNTLPGESVPLGSVIYWNDMHWLVVESMQDDEMTVRGMIQQCNRQLTWQNPETREIISRWCTIEKPYYSNVTPGTVATFSSREFKVQLPYDFETGCLDVDKKFILDIINGEPKVYKCTSIDSNTERYDIDGESIGFLVMNLTQDQYNPDKDSAEFGVCDYLPPFDIMRPTETGYLILDMSADVIVPGGFPMTIMPKYFNYSDGTPRTGDRTFYTFNCSKEVLEALKSENKPDGSLEISLTYSPYIIGEEIEIEAVNTDGTIGNRAVVKVVNSI